MHACNLELMNFKYDKIRYKKNRRMKWGLFTPTRWRWEARLKSTKANSPIWAKDRPTWVEYERKWEYIPWWQNTFYGKILTTKAVLMPYPKAFTTTVTTILLTIITSITAASNMSTWFHKNLTCISIPMLARKRAANKLRIASTFMKKRKRNSKSERDK